jgi:hypothetical protein
MTDNQTKAKPPEDNALPKDAVVVNAAILEPRKFVYRVGGTAGYHEEEEPVRTPDGKVILDPVLDGQNQPRFDLTDGKRRPVLRVRTKVVLYGPRREAGDIFRSNKEYDKPPYNPRGYPPKYVRVDEDGDPNAAALGAANRLAAARADQMLKLIEGMNVEQLRLYCEQEGIDCARLSKREQFVERIKAAWDELVPA